MLHKSAVWKYTFKAFSCMDTNIKHSPKFPLEEEVSQV